jgi:hypothetical protein
MKRGAPSGLLLLAAGCFSLIAEQPILQPNSYGYSFEGPALGLECVAALKADPARFYETVRARSPALRRPCVGQLVQALTPEPEFTTDDFQNAIKHDPNGNLTPESPEVALKITHRLGVNLAVANAVAELARDHLIDDSSAIHPLIQCLNHPLLEVSRRCEDALISLTHHSYGWAFFYSSPRVPPTVEGRQRFVADWMEWEDQLKNGHPIFDERLASESLAAVRAVGKQVANVLKDSVASGYIDYQVVQNGRLGGFGSGIYAEQVFKFDVGVGWVDNWPPGTKVDRVAIVMFRPGIFKPRSVKPEDVSFAARSDFNHALIGGNVYREEFPALDLELRVEIVTLDQALRQACFLAVKEGLAALREFNGIAASPH